MLSPIRVDLKASPVFGAAKGRDSSLNTGRTKVESLVGIVQCSVHRTVEVDAELPIIMAMLSNVFQFGLAIVESVGKGLVVSVADSQFHPAHQATVLTTGLSDADLVVGNFVNNLDGRWTACCLGDGNLG